MFRDGNPDYKKALERSTSLSSGIKSDTGDSVRQQKNNLLVLLTLCSRASIEGGLNPSVAYTLNDLYAGQIEDCRTTSALSALARKIMEDFVQKVQHAKADNGISPQIQAVCDYITMHPKEKFPLLILQNAQGIRNITFHINLSRKPAKALPNISGAQR